VQGRTSPWLMMIRLLRT